MNKNKKIYIGKSWPKTSLSCFDGKTYLSLKNHHRGCQIVSSVEYPFGFNSNHIELNRHHLSQPVFSLALLYPPI